MEIGKGKHKLKFLSYNLTRECCKRNKSNPNKKCTKNINFVFDMLNLKFIQ